MTSIPLNRVGDIVYIAQACELLGVSPGAVCRRLGLPFWHDCDPAAYAPVEHARRFLHGAARAAGSRTFGFSITEISPIERLGVVGLAIERSANVYQALKMACRLMQGNSNFTSYWLSEKADAVWLCRSGTHLMETGEDVTIQYALYAMIQVVQRGAGKAWWPKRIVLQGTQPIALPMIETSGDVSVQYHPHLTAIAVPRDLLPLPLRSPTVVPHDLPSLDEAAFLEAAPSKSLSGALKQLIATLMPNGYPAIESVAEIAGLHPRTLQRRLRHQSSSYRELVDEVRAERATVLLEVGGSVTEIAFDLGYTDVSHFIRAFRRWTGVSPSRYRQLRQAA